MEINLLTLSLLLYIVPMIASYLLIRYNTLRRINRKSYIRDYAIVESNDFGIALLSIFMPIFNLLFVILYLLEGIPEIKINIPKSKYNLYYLFFLIYKEKD